MNDVRLVGVDTGGTFTDIVVAEHSGSSLGLRHCKVLSDPGDPSGPIVEGLERLGIAGHALIIIHGTTVGTNAVLEGKGAKVAYVTSSGFADVLSLGRQERQQVYRLCQPEVEPPVPPECCFEIETRIAPDGGLLDEATEAELEDLAVALERLGVEAVAVNLLFSFLRPQEERRIAEYLGDGRFVSCSSRVLPEVREYERGMATWLNASIGPVIAKYLQRLQQRLPGAGIAVMQSAGTTIAADQAAEQAVRLLLSGPAGGLAAARSIGELTGNPRLMSFDMGGTSTDVALLEGEITLTSEGRIGDWPLSVPSVDIHTIGAGGGSIARLDRAGMLLVGPESAGADPGPACYDNGGKQVTVTDANVVLGRIPSQTLLGGYLPLDAAAANDAVARLAANMGCSVLEAARGVVRLANEHMARALRVISVERGHDPADYTLLSFGGAGGLHACDLAELLGMGRVIIPSRSGVLSAVGMLVSEPGRDLSLAVLKPLADMGDNAIGKSFRALEKDAAMQLRAEGVTAGTIRFQRHLELRYRGQSATILVDYVPGSAHAEIFHEAHRKLSGLRLPHAVELVNLRLGARAPAALSSIDIAPDGKDLKKPGQAFVADLDCEVPLLDREGLSAGEVLRGPLLVTEADATAWVKPEWTLEPDEWGNLFISRSG